MPVIAIGNQIHLLGNIDDKTANEFTEKYSVVLAHPSDEIELHISSKGGLIDPAERILAQILLSHKPVYAFIHNTSLYDFCSGVCSAASVIASHAIIKTIDFNATFMIHHSKTDGKIQEDEEDILFWMEKSQLPYDVTKSLIKTEKVMDAETAFSLGFVDIVRHEQYSLPL